MNKRGQEDVPVLSAYGLVKTIIAVVLLLIILGIVAVACGFISFAELDSGTERTFNGLVQLVAKMSADKMPQDDSGEKKDSGEEGKYHLAFIGNDLAIVGFDVNQGSIIIEGNQVVNRPFECGEPTEKSCLAICAFKDINKNSCSGKSLLRSKVLGGVKISSSRIAGVLIRGEVKRGTISVERKEDTLYISLIKS